MNELMDKYGQKGLAILGFPCNQFGHQENCKNDEILNSLKYVRPGNGFVPKIELFGKVNVNGSTADPLFVFLKNKLPFPEPDGAVGTLMGDPKAIIWNPVCRNDIAWNFDKFLVGSDGEPFKRFGTKFETKNISHDIEKLLGC